MATYDCSVQTISRSTGRTATRSAAYRHGLEVECDRTGLRHDYTRRSGVASSHVVGWSGDVPSLWNAAEAAEKRKDSTVAREVMVALPHELSAEQREALTLRMAEALRERFGVAVSAAIHLPGRHGDQRNHHAHLMCSTRIVDEAGVFGAKTRQLDNPNTSRAEVHWIRQTWQTLANRALEQAGLDARIDGRSLRARALAGELTPEEAIPRQHLGHAATALERRGEETRIGTRNAAVEQLRAVAREAAEVANQIATEERRIAAQAAPAVVPAGDGEVLEFELPTAEDILAAEARIEAETLRRLEEERRAEAEEARRVEAEAQLARLDEARRAARERAQAAIRDALAADARATTTRRDAVAAIAAVEVAADAVCDAITSGAPDARRAAERAWLSKQREPYVTAASTAHEALEASRAALRAHGAPPSWWRPFQRLAWNEESRALSTKVEAAEAHYSKASDRLREQDRALGKPSPAQHAVGEQAAQQHVTEAHRDYWRAVEAAQGAVRAAAEPSIAARDAWKAVEAARVAEASYGRPSPIPGVSGEEDRQRSEELATIRSWISGKRPITDPTLRNQAPKYEAPDPNEPSDPKPT